ncbi:hypothetical protein LO80_06295 [Candidatus Francisella endociliophora]|uniref:DUF4280 domain-containing protein n=1 Tax=Candidatus Francisella endociliophora TaxID=653937 RepID=A0A097EPW5_9GAMM|nr:type VI secretion system PAAR-like protein IglG [Francisella sp. FSC1006]AIT09610.1 hypothetical protein LO80_06295 [Francisella sp. FSC1006]
MLKELEQAIDQVKALKDQSSNIANSIETLSNELNNIKTILSPSSVNASNSASQLTSVLGATTLCSFGTGPGSYLSIRATVLTSMLPSSNITDSVIGVNVLPFPGCVNPSNPAKVPFVFPWPCVPLLTPFTPTSPTTILQGAPITTINSKAFCNFASGGVVSFINPGQFNAKTT